MTLTELSSPIRLYWDIGPHPDLSPDDYKRVSDEIVQNKFLSLQITETAASLSAPLFTVLDALKEKPIALSVVASMTAMDQDSLAKLRKYPLKVVFIEVISLQQLESLAGRLSGDPLIGFSFPVSRTNFQDLPAVLMFCIKHNVPHLLLPMQRLMTGEACFSISRQEQESLTAKLNKIDKPSSLRITIHDPFLWRAFYPSVEFPNGGCQAGNTMLYISPSLDVYACPVLPVTIGSLRRSGLKDLITSDQKKDLRKSILQTASACMQCGELERCKGGCRGRAFTAMRSFDGPDPACT